LKHDVKRENRIELDLIHRDRLDGEKFTFQNAVEKLGKVRGLGDISQRGMDYYIIAV